MSTSNYNPLNAGMDEIRKSWGGFMFLGIALTILGMVCIIFSATATSATVLVFGWLLLISGVFGLIHSFFTITWSGFFLYLLGALLRGITGFLLVRYPSIGAEALTLLLGSFFVVGGLFRATACGMARLPRWGWGAFSGIISVMLGILVLWQMPITSHWLIGLAIGIDMIFDGVAVCAFAAAIHHLPHGTVLQGA
jgi:uncharacterized membrane protein HdeD (DUF308 family)